MSEHVIEEMNLTLAPLKTTIAVEAQSETAVIKSQLSQFKVDEIFSKQLSGEGEHLYIHCKKTGQNTVWVRQKIAEAFGIKLMDVGYAGLKDRHAVTTQWFSLYLPKQQVDIASLNIEGCEFAVTGPRKPIRHNSKLRVGQLEGNHFTIEMHDFAGDKDALERRLSNMLKQGFGNYFGEQRFGCAGQNVSLAWQLISKRRLLQHPKKSIYLSSLRSFLFNQVMYSRVIADDLDTNFENNAPLWGRGRLQGSQEQVAFEMNALAPWQALCNALEHVGLQQQRRDIWVKPERLAWQWLDQSTLRLSFDLPAGSYATVLLEQLASITDSSQRSHGQ